MSTSYSDLINVPAFGKKRESTFSPDRGEVAFWCKDCKKRVEPTRLPAQKVGKKMREYLYECPDCHGNNIAIGTEEGLKAHYEKRG